MFSAVNLIIKWFVPSQGSPHLRSLSFPPLQLAGSPSTLAMDQDTKDVEKQSTDGSQAPAKDEARQR